ncbi:MAG: hypothetical protein J6L81_08905, partial [Clostridia bacterium]|nr:hypothetical protein [Clostridia bacterium]
MITGCVKGQYLSIASPLIVTDSINYLSARFYFSEDWDNAEKWAHFKLNGSETVYDIKLNNDEIPADEGLNLTTGDW